ncbi:MAG: TIGR04282 family arsenosugar biosynthesis glycosyltransferase [Opitutaceae bacterium]
MLPLSSSRRLILLCRYPTVGAAKTRLIPALGPEGANDVHRRLVLATLRTLRSYTTRHPVSLEIRTEGAPEPAWRDWLGSDLTYRPQGPGDLGERMQEALAAAFAEGTSQVVLVGSDCPYFTALDIEAAFAALDHTPVTLGPALDGGYWLIGLHRPIPDLFRAVPWSTDQVLRTTQARATQAGHAVTLLRPLGDVDRPEDLPAWLAHEGTGGVLV